MKIGLISEYADVFSGYAFSSEDLVDKGIPVLKIGNIQSGVVDKNCSSFYSEKINNKLKKYVLSQSDFLIAMTGAGSVGRAGIMIDCNDTFLVNQRVAIVRCKDSIDNKYFYYFFRLPFVENYLYSLGIGAGQPNISSKDILRIKSLFHEKKEREKVANVLFAYDKLIETNNKRIKVLEQMAEELYKEWFVRFRFPGYENTEFENGIPKGWEYIRADKVIYFNPTLKSNSQQEFTIIPMEALSTTSMVLDSSCFIRQATITGKRSQNGDTLFAKITPCLENGKTGFVMGLAEGEIAGGSTEFIVLRSKILTPHYVYCIARSYYFRQTAILSMNGADGRQRVDEGKLKSTKVLRPTKTVLDRFEKKKKK